jgi:hypothetical protein
LQGQGDFGLHVGQLFLDQLVGGQRATELLAIQGVLASGVPAGFGSAQRTPGDAVTGRVQAGERPSGHASGKMFSSGTNTLSMTISPVIDARRPTLP